MDSFDMGENMGVMILQGVIIVLAIIIVIMIYSEKSSADELQNKINSFECPACPSCPECPDCNCSEGGECPACICENESPLDCPDCPECPKTSGPTAEEIVNAIFPGRNPGMTSHGRFFSYDDFTETKLKSTFEAVDDLEASTMGGGIPSRVNFEKKFKSKDVATASKVDPPMGSGAGVFTEPSDVAETGGTAEPPAETTDSATEALAPGSPAIETPPAETGTGAGGN